MEEESGKFETQEGRKVRDVLKGYTQFKDGDVIFAKVTPCMENGKAAVMKGLTNGIGFGSTEFHVLRPSTDVTPEYLYFYITQEDFRKKAASHMTGAVGLRRVPKSYLADQAIPIPSVPEQRQIVSELEKQFTRLDAGVAALRRVQANLKRYRAAVLKAACEGKLVPTEAELAEKEHRTNEPDPVGARHAVPLPSNEIPVAKFGQPVRGSLGTIIRSYKSAVTRSVNSRLRLPGGKVWQKNYYERIIRNHAALERTRRYISDNPANWSSDPENPQRATRLRQAVMKNAFHGKLGSKK